MPGQHIVGSDSKVILYDVNSEELEIEFDFLFKDVSRGDIKMKIDFTPLIGSLPGFYRKYQSIYVGPVIDSKTRSVTRSLLSDYNLTDLTSGVVRTKIVDALTNNPEIMNYVKVHKIDIMDVRW